MTTIVPQKTRLLIVCPACGKGRLRQSEPAARFAECGECHRRYPIDRGVLDLLEGGTQFPSLGQMLMQLDPIVWIYESRLWRRSRLFEALNGITFEDEYSLIATAAKLDAVEYLLDLACGPGIYARRFARDLPEGTVAGLDLSLPMLRYASSRARVEALTNLTLIHGSAMALPFEAEQFDAVNCCGALHMFADVHQVLSEISRVLRPDGRVTIAAFRRGDSLLAERRAQIRRVLYGVSAFSPQQLASQLAQAGLTSQCLHAAGTWLIMSGQKSAL